MNTMAAEDTQTHRSTQNPQLHTVLVSPTYPSVPEDLKKLGMRVVLTQAAPELARPIAFHADLLCYPLLEQKLLLAPDLPQMERDLRELGFTLIRPCLAPGGSYPADTPLCAARVGKWLFCRRASTDPHILQTVSSEFVLNVRQGYTRCSTLVVGGNALITADPSVACAAIDAGLAVLQIRPGYIRLDGYDTGFIGGCGGMLDASTLYLTGKLCHPDAERIRRFTLERNVQLYEGSLPELTDIGSIVLLD